MTHFWSVRTSLSEKFNGSKNAKTTKLFWLTDYLRIGVCHDKKILVMSVMTLTRLVTPDLTAGELG